MVNRLRIEVVKCVVLLLITQPALCESKSNSLNVFSISIPASEIWYVAITAIGSPTSLILHLGMAMTARGLHLTCKLAPHRRI